MEDNQTRRRVLQIGSGATIVGLAGCTTFLADDDEDDDSGGNETESGTEDDDSYGNGDDTGNGDDSDTSDEDDYEDIEEPSGAFDELPTPKDPGSETFPIVGTGDAPITVELYGSLNCPQTAEFVVDGLEEFVREYVLTGEIDLELQAVAYRGGEVLHGEDGPRLARAGLAVWEHDPNSFWSFVECVIINVESESGWATPEQLERLATVAGVDDPQTVYDAAAGDAYEKELQETADAVEKLSVDEIPRITVDGETYSPNHDSEKLYAAVDDAVDDST